MIGKVENIFGWPARAILGMFQFTIHSISWVPQVHVRRGKNIPILQFCAYESWDSLFFPISMSPTANSEPRTQFLMTSLQYYCILGLAEIKNLHPSRAATFTKFGKRLHKFQ